MTRDAEDALVGCALLDPSVLDVVGLDPSHFSGIIPGIVWRRLLEMRATGRPMDPVLVADGLPHESEILSYLSRCFIETMTADNAEHYADTVRRDKLTRDVQAAAALILDYASKGIEGDNLHSEALRLVAGVRSDSRQAGLTMADVLRSRYREHSDHQDSVAAGDVARSGFPTGITALDKLLGGISPGIATIVAGRPGMGKSAVGMSIAMACVKDGHGAHVFSLEDTRSAYADRLLSRVSQVPCEALSGGRLLNIVEQRELRTAAERAAKIQKWLIDDRSGIDAAEVVRSVRRSARDNGTRIVVVDYVQLLKRPPRTSQHEHLGQQLLILADAAKQDGMAYVVMSQLNRGLESRDDKTPRLSDLRESGNLEEFAKVVIAVHRPWVYDREKDESEMVICVLKKNQGQIGRAVAHFDGPLVTVR